MRRLATATLTALSLLAAGAVTCVTPAPAAAAPTISATRVVGGLRIPWDVTWVGSVLLFNQHAGGIWSKRGTGTPERVSLPLPRIFAQSEGGMLGMVADPAAATNKYFYTCFAVANSSGGPQDVQVWKWRLASDTSATLVKVLIRGIPLTSGRHSGCRLRFRSSGMLYVGTGDAVQGTAPQSLSSLGGKVLRVRSDGSTPTTNPFYSRGGSARYVWSYGHRNIQGLAKRPGTTEMWSVEHGTSRDDEVNRVLRGDNYGWDPAPGYDESHPMTDTVRYPNATRAKWRSGYPTVATSGATFLSGSRWGTWNGRLAVAMLKGQGVKLFSINSAGQIDGQQTVLTGYGRIRTVQQGPDGALYFTTSAGTDDRIYRVAPV